ncbi:hypothetical protein BU25DRAFT_456439 [Macroventuria anomochaeta]|uniref:Uncharacterized protein n=1 Tax=Macroventuria anomochaeta TaxID=301207 RepID=A0ACB6SA91_9PLEO|nr:uncharacterized protein BU25DRAFT_456439 [Macroventuria anomochaeta]KAF2630022.1 hypothetical protein BU25DRAFT_456439 [Macroventuria anomochaeta]
MFLIAFYSPVFHTNSINSYFPPSQWIHSQHHVVEIFTIFHPAYQVIKHWRAQRLAEKRKWDTSSLATTISVRPQSRGSTIELIDRNASVEYLQSGDRLMTMTALTRVLNENPAPLQDFSPRHDFSGEHIAFLTRLAKPKDLYPVAKSEQAYDAVLRCQQLKSLEDIFETQGRAVCGEASFEPALPFFEPPKTASSSPTEAPGWLQYQGGVPEEFHEGVLDDAKNHIESLVLTNV